MVERKEGMSWKPLACHGCDPCGGVRDKLTWLPFWGNSDPSSGHLWRLICHDLGQAIKLASASSLVSVKQLNSSFPEGRSWPEWGEGEKKKACVLCKECHHLSQKLPNLFLVAYLFYSFFFSLLLSDFLCKCRPEIVCCFTSRNAFFISAHIQKPVLLPKWQGCSLNVVVGIGMVSGKLSSSLPLPGLSILFGNPPAPPTRVPKGALQESVWGSKLLGWEVPVSVARSTTVLVRGHFLSLLSGWIIRNGLYIQLCILESKLG